MKPKLNSKILILICILSIFIVRSYAYTSETYNKSDDDVYISPIGGGYFTLQDGSKLFRFYRPLDDGNCNEPNLHLKILYANGTLLPFNIQNFSPPKFNFCRLNASPLSPDYIQITTLRSDTSNFYILYYNISDTDYTLPFGRSILQVDMEGNMLGENWLGYANFYNNSIVGRLGKFKYIYDSYYYVQLVDIHNPNLLSWQKFALTPINGLLYKEGSEGVVSRDYLSLQYDNPIYTFETIDSGLGFIYSKNYSQINSNSELEPHTYIYVNFFNPDMNNFTDPFIIYQTSIPDINMKFAMCAADTLGIGYQCVLQLRKITSVSENSLYDGFNLVLLISFLSSGSVTGIKQLSGNYATADLVIRYPLSYGGYLLMYTRDTPDGGRLIDGEILDTNDVLNSKWDIPENFVLPFPYVVIYNFIEKKFEIISNITQKDFTIVSSEIPKFINTDDRSLTLAAAKIDSIEPPNNTTISLGTSTLKINYEVPVSLSIRNITIYQIDGKIIRTRQTTSGQISEFCSIDSDHKIISVNVLPSAFNVPNSEYHVYISPDFVKHNSTDEPINMLPHTSWILYTENSGAEEYADSFSGSIRLTPDGTTMFKSNPKNFTDNLLQEISLILPVDLDRLSSEGTNQIDTSTPSEQLIIPLTIKYTKDTSKRNSDHLHNDLNIMIKNRGFTETSMHPYTSLLDETYGYKLKVDIEDIIKNNKESLIGMMIVLLLIIIAFLWGKRRNNKGNNFVIFKIGLSIVDFVLDGLFIYKNGNDIKALYAQSLAIFILSTAFNLIAALSLTIYENSHNHEFNEWFKSNPLVASTTTLLSATNIEVLNTLCSRFGGLNMFSAIFSRKTESLIFWFSILNFFIEDIPQFCIQVVYKTRVVSYSVIPFLSLVTSSLMIVFNLIGRLYNSIIQCQKDRRISNYYHGKSKFDID